VCSLTTLAGLKELLLSTLAILVITKMPLSLMDNKHLMDSVDLGSTLQEPDQVADEAFALVIK